MLNPSNSLTHVRSGALKKKQHPLSFWTSCYAELRQNELYILSSQKSKRISARIPISQFTHLEMKRDRSTPYIQITNGKSFIKLTSNDQTEVARWLAILRSAIDHVIHFSIDNFIIRATIGRGYFGKVMLVEHKDTNQIYALKTIHKNRISHPEIILSERNLLGRVDHPFIISLRFAFQSATKFYFGMDFVPGGDLSSLMRQRSVLPLQLVRLYIAEIGLALEYLHSLGIIYRDLKPENVLIDASGHLKLTDFGLAKEIGTSRTSTFCGTAEFVPPEMIGRRGYGLAADWWQLGIITFELLYNHTPFYDSNRSLMFRKITHDHPKFPNGIDPNTQDFIRSLLTKEPRNRPSFADLKSHPFWDGLDFEEVLHKRVTPSYIPNLQGPDDLRYFDENFIREEPVDSIVEPNLATNVYRNFSFINDDAFCLPPDAAIAH